MFCYPFCLPTNIHDLQCKIQFSLWCTLIYSFDTGFIVLAGYYFFALVFTIFSQNVSLYPIVALFSQSKIVLFMKRLPRFCTVSTLFWFFSLSETYVGLLLTIWVAKTNSILNTVFIELKSAVYPFLVLCSHFHNSYHLQYFSCFNCFVEKMVLYFFVWHVFYDCFSSL